MTSRFDMSVFKHTTKRARESLLEEKAISRVLRSPFDIGFRDLSV